MVAEFLQEDWTVREVDGTRKEHVDRGECLIQVETLLERDWDESNDPPQRTPCERRDGQECAAGVVQRRLADHQPWSAFVEVTDCDKQECSAGIRTGL